MALVRGLNHITLAVSDLDRSIAFYRDGLGLTFRKRWDGGAHLEVGPFWLCLSLDEQARRAPHPDYTHMAFDVAQEDFAAAVEQVKQAGAGDWRQNKSEGDSFYFLDPDGHKLELHVGTLETRLAAMAEKGQ